MSGFTWHFTKTCCPSCPAKAFGLVTLQISFSSLTSVFPSRLICPEMVTAFVELLGAFRPEGLASAAFEECCAATVMGISRATASRTRDHSFIVHAQGQNGCRNDAILEPWNPASNGKFRCMAFEILLLLIVDMQASFHYLNISR